MMLLLGLGNPGRKYTKSRHNAGIWCIDAIVNHYNLQLSNLNNYAALTRVEIENKPVIISSSAVYMNNSGVAARYLLKYFRLTPQNLMVIYDDMDLPVGTIRIRPNGSAAGHHGIESIIEELHTDQFPRLRIGIGHPAKGTERIPHVLGSFNSEDSLVMQHVIDQSVQALICTIKSGLETAMNQFN